MKEASEGLETAAEGMVADVEGSECEDRAPYQSLAPRRHSFILAIADLLSVPILSFTADSMEKNKN